MLDSDYLKSFEMKVQRFIRLWSSSPGSGSLNISNETPVSTIGRMCGFGGFSLRFSASSQFIDLKNGCSLISSASPGPAPRRCFGSRLSSFTIRSSASEDMSEGTCKGPRFIFSNSFSLCETLITTLKKLTCFY